MSDGCIYCRATTIRTRIDELLSLLGLQAEEKKLALEYSHGMQKKLALAAALLPNPDLLFLDEPFEGVDAVTSRVIRDLLAGYVARGSTVFLTSHVLEIVEKLCTHVGIIVKGTLVEQASLEDIRRGISLEERFLEKAGAGSDSEAIRTLSWLEEGAREPATSQCLCLAALAAVHQPNAARRRRQRRLPQHLRRLGPRDGGDFLHRRHFRGAVRF